MESQAKKLSGPPRDFVVAALTGDLIASSQSTRDEIDAAMSTLRSAAFDIERWKLGGSAIVGKTFFTRFRGDGWQAYIDLATFSLRASIYLFSRLAAQNELPRTRVAVGLANDASETGSLTHIPGTDLSDADGPAFAVSGRALSDMKNDEVLRVSGATITPLHSAFVGFVNDRLTDWTPEQAEAVAFMLPPDTPTQTAVAQTLNISPQALSYRLSGAKWPTLRHLLKEWEKPHDRPEDFA